MNQRPLGYEGKSGSDTCQKDPTGPNDRADLRHRVTGPFRSISVRVLHSRFIASNHDASDPRGLTGEDAAPQSRCRISSGSAHSRKSSTTSFRFALASSIVVPWLRCRGRGRRRRRRRLPARSPRCTCSSPSAWLSTLRECTASALDVRIDSSTRPGPVDQCRLGSSKRSRQRRRRRCARPGSHGSTRKGGEKLTRCSRLRRDTCLRRPRGPATSRPQRAGPGGARPVRECGVSARGPRLPSCSGAAAGGCGARHASYITA